MDVMQIARFFKAIERVETPILESECPTIMEGNFLMFDVSGRFYVPRSTFAEFFALLADKTTGSAEETIRNEVIALGDRYGQ